MKNLARLLFVIAVSVLPACGGGDVQNPAATDTSQSSFEPKLPLPRAVAEITPVSTSSALASQAVNLQDAIAILKMIVGLEVNSSGQPVTAYQSYAADVDGNGKVELADAIAVLKRIVGLETQTANWLFFNQTDSALVVSDRLSPGLAPDLKAYVTTSATTSNVGLVSVLRGDVVGSQFSYAWSLTSKPANSSATLTGANAASPKFTPDVVGSYVATLTVSDGSSNTSLTSITLTAALALPGMPTIGAATPDDSTASIEFIPGSTGDQTVTYAASCTANGAVTVTTSGTASPITVTGLTNGVTYACKITPSSVAGIGSASGSMSVTPAIPPLFASAPILLPDLMPKMEALCGRGKSAAIQNGLPMNLTGHRDGRKDLLFALWCGLSNAAGISITTPTLNGVVAFIQNKDGSFSDGTKELFGIDILEIGGQSHYAATSDFNKDGYDDAVFSVSREDGRDWSIDHALNGVPPAFLTSRADGKYFLEKKGTPEWGYGTMTIDNEYGGKDVLVGGEVYDVWRFTDSWRVIANYPWASPRTYFFNRTNPGESSKIAVVGENSGKQLSLYIKGINGAWSMQSNYSVQIPDSPVATWIGWNGQVGQQTITKIDGKDYTSIYFDAVCELKPTKNTSSIVISAFTGYEITGGYTGQVLIEGKEMISTTRLMAFSVDQGQIAKIPIVIRNEITKNFALFGSGIKCQDLNSDGFDDIIMITSGQKPIIYINDGTGAFDRIDSSIFPGTSNLGAVVNAYGDIDGDGVPDLLYFSAIGSGDTRFPIYKGLRKLRNIDKK